MTSSPTTPTTTRTIQDAQDFVDALEAGNYSLTVTRQDDPAFAERHSFQVEDRYGRDFTWFEFRSGLLSYPVNIANHLYAMMGHDASVAFLLRDAQRAASAKLEHMKATAAEAAV